MRGTTKARLVFGGIAVAAITLGAASTATPSLTPTPDRSLENQRAGFKIAREIIDEDDRKALRSARFSVIPPSGRPAAVSNERLAGFPLDGKTFGVLSTGDATRADDDNDDPDTGHENGGPFIRGARDVTILKINLNVPSDANCLSIRFKFLSEEFPEFVNEKFNDGFIAELDKSTWTTNTAEDPTVLAPDNFARNARGDRISVNGVGDTTVRAANAKGTTYDGATQRLRASTKVSRGRHSLYLSIFDQGDRFYDSAVFLDKLTLTDNDNCKSGAVKD